jgi:hypothetical protein
MVAETTGFIYSGTNELDRTLVTMEYICLQNKTDRRFVLLCDQNFNPISEQDAGQGKPRNKAFYVRFSGGFMGVYSSSKGPVLFVNDRKFFFTDWTWSLSIQKKAGVNKVDFTGLTHDVLMIEYLPVELDPLDPWSEEQFDDFFIWLVNKRHDREFIGMWTDKE